jgi:Tn3 transposase DDE domain
MGVPYLTHSKCHSQEPESRCNLARSYLAILIVHLNLFSVPLHLRPQYLDLVASAVIFQNAVDISLAVQALSAERFPIDRKALAKLSPYPTGQLKRYGDIVIDMETIPGVWQRFVSEKDTSLKAISNSGFRR